MLGLEGGGGGFISASTTGAMGDVAMNSDMPKPFSDALGSGMNLPARGPMSHLPARVTLGLLSCVRAL